MLKPIGETSASSQDRITGIGFTLQGEKQKYKTTRQIT